MWLTIAVSVALCGYCPTSGHGAAVWARVGAVVRRHAGACACRGRHTHPATRTPTPPHTRARSRGEAPKQLRLHLLRGGRPQPRACQPRPSHPSLPRTPHRVPWMCPCLSFGAIVASEVCSSRCLSCVIRRQVLLSGLPVALEATAGPAGAAPPSPATQVHTRVTSHRCNSLPFRRLRLLRWQALLQAPSHYLPGTPFREGGLSWP